MAPSKKRICIVGAGVIGLTTAYTLLTDQSNDELNGEMKPSQPMKTNQYDVIIFTDRSLEETTSFGPPGIFRGNSTGESVEDCRRWAEISHAINTRLLYDSSASENGVQLVSGYLLSNDLADIQQTFDFYDGMAPVRMLSPQEMPPTGNSPQLKYGILCTAYTTEGRMFVPWLAKRVTEMGAKIIRKKVMDFRELEADFDVIVNCSGLGAQQLAQDTNVEPIRGILLKVKAPWIKHFYYYGADHSTYILPGVDFVYLGGVRETGNYSTEISQQEIDNILQKTTNVLPSLKNAEYVSSWVGLRPGRIGGPRLEKTKTILNNGRRVTIIHNYGHAGNGFVKCWGCAHDVKQLIEENHLSML